MFLKHAQIAPDRIAGLLRAAETAARAIPPAFPLDATVAVNPLLGQTGEDLATASARMQRVAGLRLTRPRSEMRAAVRDGLISDDDLAAALLDCRSGLKPADLAWLKARLGQDEPAPAALPTMADLAATETGTDWPAVVARCIGLWATGHFDRGQALWTPAPGKGAFAAWREWATHDLTPELAGLTGFCAHVAACPDTPERTVLRAAERLGLTDEAAPTAFHRLLVDLGGWAQHARWILWQAELAGGTDATLTDLLAIRLVWEEALLAHVPALARPWAEAVAAHAIPVAPGPDDVLDAVVQEAAERAHQRWLDSCLTGPAAPVQARPAVQAAFCIDVRSEVFRRALEAQDGGIVTLGFAGFFGLPLSHAPHGTDLAQAHLPVLLRPALHAQSHAAPEAEHAARIGARATRAWGRFRQAAVSSFAFVEAAGPFYAGKLVRDALGLAGVAGADPAPRFDPPLSAAQKVATAAAVLQAMGLTGELAPLVLLVGHGATTTNNPHASAYHCGACGGQTGAVSARLLAALLNDPETRAGLDAQGLGVPPDTVFVAGLHDTTTDAVTLWASAQAPDSALATVRGWLRQAGAMARAERALRLPGANAATVADRADDWSEVRPEWGLAGCAAFVAAPRSVTRGADLQGRAFLHDYDWTADPGFATLELILTAPVVVASWISLQYYGSTVVPGLFGGGNKLIHNVVGGFGVVEGNGGRLRAGLPWQAVHDGSRPMHEALRLSVLVEAPADAITGILERHPGVRTLVENAWLHLIRLDGGRMQSRCRPGLVWDRL